MEIGWRDLLTMIHGLGFGALFMLAFTGAFAETYRMSAPTSPIFPSPKDIAILRFYLIGMVVLAWLTVFLGTYIIYPWYRAIPSVTGANLQAFPQQLLMSSPDTSGWHSVGMRWKEHVAWLAPISMTMVAYVVAKYGPSLGEHRGLRKAVIMFTLAAFLATGIAGLLGSFLNKYAPIRGGESIHLMRGE